MLYEKSADGAIATVTLNRPHVLNAYNIEMRDGVYEALQAVRDDPEVRVMVLRGNGRAFSTGGDLSEFGRTPPVRARAARWHRDVWGTLWALPKLTVAAVHGVVVGGGFEMAMLCDQCLAADDARFALPETGVGMIPGVAGTQTLPRLAGVGRALDVMLAGRWIDAPTARRWGIVNGVVAAGRLRVAAARYARTLAGIAPELVAAVKQAVNDGLDRPLPSGLELERRVTARG